MKKYPDSLELFLITIGHSEHPVSHFEVDHNEGTFYVEVTIQVDEDGKRIEWATYEAPLEILYHPNVREATELWYSLETLEFLEEQSSKIWREAVEVGFGVIVQKLRDRISVLEYILNP